MSSTTQVSTLHGEYQFHFPTLSLYVTCGRQFIAEFLFFTNAKCKINSAICFSELQIFKPKSSTIRFSPQFSFHSKFQIPNPLLHLLFLIYIPAPFLNLSFHISSSSSFSFHISHCIRKFRPPSSLP